MKYNMPSVSVLIRTQTLPIVHYRLPFGIPGRLFAGALVRRKLDAIFAFRHRVLSERFGTLRNVAERINPA